MAINYIEKGIGLHKEIFRQGYKLYELNGEWISNNDIAVQGIIDNYDASQIPAGWSAFAAAMLTDTDFNALYNAAAAANGLLANSIQASLATAREGDFDSFEIIYNQLISLSSIPQSLKDRWANFAAANFLPQEFEDIIRGN